MRRQFIVKLIICVLTILVCCGPCAAGEITIFSFDNNYRPIVNKKAITAMPEGIKAIIAMYSLQRVGGCTGGPNGIECELTNSLEIGEQCSKEHIGFVGKWFKDRIPKMGGYAKPVYESIQADNLESICYTTPESAREQATWETIKVRIKKNKIHVDAIYFWTESADGPSGRIGYKTDYKIINNKINIVSHIKYIDAKDEN